MIGTAGSRAVFAGMLAGSLLVLPALAQSEKRTTSPYRPVKVTYKAKNYYTAAWGIDRLKVSRTASGNLIRFSFRITHPARAAALIDRNATPRMLGQRSRALLSIPAMEKIGPLRQTGPAKAGQEYWMTFSNKGNLVKPGDRVNVMIGQFRAEGLVVE